MKRQIWQATLGLSFALAAVGCNVGMAPQGPDQAEIKARMAKLPIDEQIKLIRSSPMSEADKEKKIAELQGGKGDTTTATAPPGSGR